MTLLLALFGLWSLQEGYRIYRSTNEFLRTSSQSQGKVIRLNTKEASIRDGSTVHYPVVQFQDLSGADVEFESEVGDNPAAFEVGDLVDVAYQTDDAKNAKINTFGSLWVGCISMSAFGAIFSGAGLLTGVSLIRRRLM